MRSRRKDAHPGLERTIAAASLLPNARESAVLRQLMLVHRELVAEAARLAIRIEERLTPRSRG